MSEPKFRVGDVVRGLYGVEFTIAGFDAPGRAYASDGRLPHDIRDLTLVYRPPSRAEAEALRTVADAAKKAFDASDMTVLIAALDELDAITND